VPLLKRKPDGPYFSQGDDEFQPAPYVSSSRSFIAMMGQWVNSRNSRTHRIENGSGIQQRTGTVPYSRAARHLTTRCREAIKTNARRFISAGSCSVRTELNVTSTASRKIFQFHAKLFLTAF